MTEPKALEEGRKVVRLCLLRGAREAEVLVYSIRDQVTRFSRNQLNQSSTLENAQAQIRVISSSGYYAGGSTTGTASSAGISRLVDDILSRANGSERHYYRKSFGSKRKAPRITGVFSKLTTAISSEEGARAAGEIIEQSLEYDRRIERMAGTIVARTAVTAITNSNGLSLSHRYTGASVVVTPLAKEDGSIGIGYASESSHDYRELDFEKVTLEASEEAVKTLRPKPIELGSYDVIFGPNAAGDIIGTFVQLGLSVMRLPSYVKVGSRCASNELTVVDNPLDSRALMSTPFDAEGTPTRRLTLIDGGLAKAKCSDFKSTNGMRSTGHAPYLHDGTYSTKFFPGWSYYPLNQFVRPGDVSIDELMKESKRAVIIKRLMYAGLPMGISGWDTIQAFSMGTWFVERGELEHALPSMRISDSLSRMVRRLDLVGNRSTVKRLGALTVPWVRSKSVSLTEMASLAVPEETL